jgi:hypothetical protein
MSSPLPVIICGKIPSHLASVPRALQPEYEGTRHIPSTWYPAAFTLTLLVTHCIYNIDLFLEIFPNLEQKPVAIFMGGGYDNKEFETAFAVQGAKDIAWFRPAIYKKGNEYMLGKAPPPANVIAANARKVINEHADVLKNGSGAGQVFYY